MCNSDDSVLLQLFSEEVGWGGLLYLDAALFENKLAAAIVIGRRRSGKSANSIDCSCLFAYLAIKYD